MAKKAADLTTQLEAARAITDDAALLDALLVAYRARPLPGLVELIAIAGKRAATEHPMTGSLNDQHAMWRGVATLERATDLEWLIANVITGRTEYSIERITLLERWPVDPRLASGLLGLAAGKQMTTAKVFWRDAFRFINKQAHPGLAAILAPMLALEPTTAFERSLLKKLRVIEAKLARLESPSPSTTETAALGKLAERLQVKQVRAAAKTADDFLRQIWAAPADDSLREVFADWLQERGDPRGEFISLQLARARRRLEAAKRPTGKTISGITLRVALPDETKALARERALLAKHKREWAAPFEAVLSLPKSTFESGFLHTAHVHWRKLSSVPALMTHPAWATVRQFSFDLEGAKAVDPWIDHMIGLGAKRD